MGNKKYIVLEAGQSTVEYILLLAVVITIVNSVFNSDGFQNIFGGQGTFAKVYKEELEFSYRNAMKGRAQFQEPNYYDRHPSYVKGAETRFFSSKEVYP